MTFGVFITRTDSIYDDTPAERYQFPKQYLQRVRACVGDWIVYYEPTKIKESRGYFAIAFVQQVIPDPAVSGMYLAIIAPDSYCDFVNDVPFRINGDVLEKGLLNEQGKISGRAQSAVREISSFDFNQILEIGLPDLDEELPRNGEYASGGENTGLEDEQVPFVFEHSRKKIVQLTTRNARDKNFRRLILRIYDKRCAITGLKLINGGGRAEVDAAHIRPVAANGPDMISNGLALSGTAHWMFDRGLIGLTNDFQILVSRHVNDPSSVEALINKTGKAIVPERTAFQPHQKFLQWHRENCFKH